jgi:hypothetical protein
VDTLHRFFPSFRLDARNAQLWRGDHEIGLRRKTVDVLLYLVDHPGQTAQCERLTRNPFVARVPEDATACFPSKMILRSSTVGVLLDQRAMDQRTISQRDAGADISIHKHLRKARKF